ncbi:ROK family transcriptional regulator [Humibacter sp. RRB41]|uniref:ROK family transcriptional regulator n=1 Tax=Humibacter sp. RRB41 TaxID=2919946 RepID=UPI001FAAAFF3|nr:ROK family transcriptional regulator [Humibacter sp. RRB41]
MTRRLKGASSADTRSAILDLIRSSGQVSRIELSEKSGLTEATISKIVRALIVDGLVVEAGFAESTGGKRPVLLELNTASRYALGVSLDYARISLVLCNISGNVLHSHAVPGAGRSKPQTVIDRVAREIGKFLDKHGIDRSDVIGIGVSGAGRLDASGGVLRSSRQTGEWEEFAIEAALCEATGMPVILENDANCAALGEFWSGRVSTAHDFATIYMATGIGCGLVINGDVYRGASSNAGEIGHLSLDIDGPECFCGSHGCLEVMATPAAVVRNARDDRALWERLGLQEREGEDVRTSFATIAAAAMSGDESAESLVRRSAQYVATAVLGLTNIFDLDRIYLAGPGFATAGPIYLGVVRDVLERTAFMRKVHSVAVEMGETGPGAAARGAASVVLHSHLTPHHLRG